MHRGIVCGGAFPLAISVLLVLLLAAAAGSAAQDLMPEEAQLPGRATNDTSPSQAATEGAPSSRAAAGLRGLQYPSRPVQIPVPPARGSSQACNHLSYQCLGVVNAYGQGAGCAVQVNSNSLSQTLPWCYASCACPYAASSLLMVNQCYVFNCCPRLGQRGNMLLSPP
ncbi:unnamed protein product [Vitrella brassicaformis CCMP3155]|uniref:Uncharacterized protein n=1 Tax=Vitrella brassicaformis (strain CCMP3155) TaxID=1169540 RepID=A0A0G4EUP5_VITBC|nr:unnamed protein product [Vitrella brassicaformis CCMP3155]|mmetsp:Transcript_23097/g.66164  ORF Transcript_23097/g.66164 Transcript_23097/m.66164 type:complete len:168 (-) Transcript_23097:1408-1911(-)|eukprot:CEM01963.1 unnamed protein product [Vitrella brassicaformis CCMP3155]